MNYIKKFFTYEEVKENTWISGLIFFQDEGKMVLDRGFVIIGDIRSYPFYCQFKNFTMINGDFYYLYPNCMKKINPEKVFLHLRFGKSPFPIEKNNLTYWHLFFTNPNNKIYKSIELKKEKIKLFEFLETGFECESINNPLFLKKQSYDKNSILFSGLKMCDFIY